MVNLTQRWAEEYMKLHPEVSIQVTGGGSGIGIAALLNGTVQIANISRELKNREMQNAAALKIEPVQFKVSLDGIAVIVHPSNPVDTLSLQQIKDIYSGKITNWKNAGGLNQNIVLYGRENSSGTYEYFKEIVLGKDDSGSQIDFARRTQVLQGTAALGEAVAHDKKGIGYGGVGYFALRNDLKVLHIKLSETGSAKSPVENGRLNFQIIWNGEYPLSRYLYCYTNGQPKEGVKEFLDFIQSPAGQKIVEEMEYIPLNKYDAVGN